MKKIMVIAVALTTAAVFFWRKRQANQADHALWAGSTDSVD